MFIVLMVLESELVFKSNLCYSPFVTSNRNTVFLACGCMTGSAEVFGRWVCVDCKLYKYVFMMESCYWQYLNTVLPYSNTNFLYLLLQLEARESKICLSCTLAGF